MMYMGHYEMKPLIYGKFMKRNKCIHTNNMLENGFMSLDRGFELDVINASITCTKYEL